MSLNFVEVKSVHPTSKEWRVCYGTHDKPRKISNMNFGRIHRIGGEYHFEAQTWASLTVDEMKQIVTFLEKIDV